MTTEIENLIRSIGEAHRDLLEISHELHSLGNAFFRTGNFTVADDLSRMAKDIRENNEIIQGNHCEIQNRDLLCQN